MHPRATRNVKTLHPSVLMRACAPTGHRGLWRRRWRKNERPPIGSRGARGDAAARYRLVLRGANGTIPMIVHIGGDHNRPAVVRRPLRGPKMKTAAPRRTRPTVTCRRGRARPAPPTQPRPDRFDPTARARERRDPHSDASGLRAVVVDDNHVRSPRAWMCRRPVGGRLGPVRAHDVGTARRARRPPSIVTSEPASTVTVAP